MNSFWNGICDICNDIIAAVVILLPDSPFANLELPNEVKEILGYVNYFVPFAHMLAIGTAWTGAIALYYALQAILRWAKAIK